MAKKKDDKDQRARENGWLVLSPEEAYEIHLSQYSWVFILKDKYNRWMVWRGYWTKEKKLKASREKTIIENVGFDVALKRGTGYVRYIWECQRKAELSRKGGK